MKKFMVLWVVVFLCLFGGEACGDQVSVTIPDFEVRINGVLIDNENARYPLLSYNDITYFPMTWNYSRSLGLGTTWSAEEGLGIDKMDPAESIELDTDGSNDMNASYEASIAAFNIKVNGTAIDNGAEEYPLLLFRDVTYFPMTWRFCVDEFGWDYVWTAESGLSIKGSRYAWMEELQENHSIYENYGNTPSNIFRTSDSISYLESWVVEDDEYYYMIHVDDIDEESGIFKISKKELDSSGDVVSAVKLIDGFCYNLMISDGYLYFNKDGGNLLGRFDLDSGNFEILVYDIESNNIILGIYDDIMMFGSNMDGEPSVYLYDIEGKAYESVEMDDLDYVEEILLEDEFIYYTYRTDKMVDGELEQHEETGFYRLSILSGEKEKLQNFMYEFVYEDGKIYDVYSEKNELGVSIDYLMEKKVDGDSHKLLSGGCYGISSYDVYDDTAVMREGYGNIRVLNIETRESYWYEKSWGSMFNTQFFGDDLFYLKQDEDYNYDVCVTNTVNETDYMFKFYEDDDSAKIYLIDLME